MASERVTDLEDHHHHHQQQQQQERVMEDCSLTTSAAATNSTVSRKVISDYTDVINVMTEFTMYYNKDTGGGVLESLAKKRSLLWRKTNLLAAFSLTFSLFWFSIFQRFYRAECNADAV